MGADPALSAKFRLEGKPATHRTLLETTLEADNWRVHWTNDRKGSARLGKKALYFLFGGLAQYYEIGFELAEHDGATTLNLYRLGDGVFGGLVGMKKVKKQFETVSESVRSSFERAGLLIG